MIILTHHTGEPHGILGAQVAATFFERRLSVPSVVVGIERDFSKERLLRFIDKHYAGKEKVLAFSHLCGRKDLFGLAQKLKEGGFTSALVVSPSSSPKIAPGEGTVLEDGLNFVSLRLQSVPVTGL